jgi:hypothetical protein
LHDTATLTTLSCAIFSTENGAAARPLLKITLPSQIAGHLFALTASWARLLGRAFISRPTQRRARELLLREVPGVQIEPDHDEE